MLLIHAMNNRVSFIWTLPLKLLHGDNIRDKKYDCGQESMASRLAMYSDTNCQNSHSLPRKDLLDMQAFSAIVPLAPSMCLIGSNWSKFNTTWVGDTSSAKANRMCSHCMVKVIHLPFLLYFYEFPSQCLCLLSQCVAELFDEYHEVSFHPFPSLGCRSSCQTIDDELLLRASHLCVITFRIMYRHKLLQQRGHILSWKKRIDLLDRN